MKRALVVMLVSWMACWPLTPWASAGTTSETLKLLGEGTFRYLGMKLYTAKFYRGAKNESKRLVIHYLRDIPRDALIRAAEKNLRNNPRVDFKRLKDRIDKLHEQYTHLKKGDVYELLYENGITRLYHNGSLKTQIEGMDFASAYFGIWISDHSISKKLTHDLLGGKA